MTQARGRRREGAGEWNRREGEANGDRCKEAGRQGSRETEVGQHGLWRGRKEEDARYLDAAIALDLPPTRGQRAEAEIYVEILGRPLCPRRHTSSPTWTQARVRARQQYDFHLPHTQKRSSKPVFFCLVDLHLRHVSVCLQSSLGAPVATLVFRTFIVSILPNVPYLPLMSNTCRVAHVPLINCRCMVNAANAKQNVKLEIQERALLDRICKFRALRDVTPPCPRYTAVRFPQRRRPARARPERRHSRLLHNFGLQCRYW